ncbi:MAG: ParB/RepB/Spo0J family partition protein, partial [Actinomycetota bacterium]|nr:ParB/RepB/Spo0J family partition protein [Actinomycetota bacterium]
MRKPKPRRDTDLLELDDVERRLRPFARRYLGVRTIPLEHVVGTEGRAAAFTRDFRPRHTFSRDRMRSLAAAFPDGGFPPIVAVKLGETYFVIDGHHRVAFARRAGADTI